MALYHVYQPKINKKNASQYHKLTFQYFHIIHSINSSAFQYHQDISYFTKGLHPPNESIMFSLYLKSILKAHTLELT